MTTPFETYLAKIQADYKGGNATEYTYRSALEHLLESLAPEVDASSDPKHIACGAPDFIVERRHVPLGYLETKDVGADLDDDEKSDQLKRYRASLHNLILTDYLEFRWYVNGAKKLTTRIADVGAHGRAPLRRDDEGIAKTAQLFEQFYSTEVPTVGTPKELAQRMAALTKIVRDLIAGSLREEDEQGMFHKQLNAFRHFLLPTLKPDEFADMYAQTMAYGLFAARVNAPTAKDFTRASAYQFLPQANPFLRRLFLDVGEELDGTAVAPFLDDLAALLAHADMSEILKTFGKQTQTSDPVVHFYETFLAAYDPKLRESRGVYYTPEPVVQFIVNSVHELLQSRFNRPLGLADGSVLLLDPATGTATFLYEVMRRIHQEQLAHGQAGAWKQYAHDKLLPRIFGFELLMAPYAVAHLKLGLLLGELGYSFAKHERLGVFLTNTLEQGVKQEATFGIEGYLSEEGSEAAKVKHDNIMVVLGNPPYSGHSANQGEWIGALVRDYYFVDGKPLGERQSKWLQDDYVKFIRFAQWRIAQTGQGIVAFITNHGYLDNPTFRGMRQNLLATFDEIYVLDLHGNAKKREVAPDGGKDENVFDIQQGVAILLAVKRPSTAQRPSPQPSPRRGEGAQLPSPFEGEGQGVRASATVRHAHLWGTRQHKYETLASHSSDSTQWTDLQPSAPFYLFVPQDIYLREEYDQGWKLTELMPTNNVGFVTARDRFVIDFDEKQLRKRIEEFRATEEYIPTHEIESKYGVKNTSSWNIRKARARVRANPAWEHDFTKCLYRPFDLRHIYYSLDLLERPVYQIQSHMLVGINIGLICPRRIETGGNWNHIFCSPTLVDHVSVSLKSVDYVFPLYLYTTAESTEGTMFAQRETTRTPNLAPAFIEAFSAKLGMTFVPDGRGDLQKTFGPEDVFHYAYALFHSPTYRTRYAEFLKMDFPRLPLTSNKQLFTALAAFGAQLVALHLLQAPTLDSVITTYPVDGSNAVESVRFAPSPAQRGRVGVGVGDIYINATQYFGSVPADVWAFKVGGYQVCEKWLKDRKGRTLSGDDIDHYQRIVVALRETIRLMNEIDSAIPQWPIA